MSQFIEPLEGRRLLASISVVDEVPGDPVAPQPSPAESTEPTFRFAGVVGTKRQLRRNRGAPVELAFFGPMDAAPGHAVLTSAGGSVEGTGGVFATGIMFDLQDFSSMPSVSRHTTYLGKLDPSGRHVTGEVRTTEQVFIQRRRRHPVHGSAFVLRMHTRTYKSVFLLDRVAPA